MNTATTEHVVKLKRPHDLQKNFLDSLAKRKIVRAGRSGKTTVAAILAVQAFLEGRRILYAVPVSDQAEYFWREVKAALAELVTAGVLRQNLTERFIEKPDTKQRPRQDRERDQRRSRHRRSRPPPAVALVCSTKRTSPVRGFLQTAETGSLSSRC